MCHECEQLAQAEGWAFLGFDSGDARRVLRPDGRRQYGVYMLWVQQRGGNVAHLEVADLFPFEAGAWPLVDEEFQRVAQPRLEAVTACDCDIVYIGRSGVPSTQRDLYCRFREYANGGHSGWPAVWALVAQGWQLQFGYRQAEYPAAAERQLMCEYADAHGDAQAMPAFNLRRPAGCNP